MTKRIFLTLSLAALALGAVAPASAEVEAGEVFDRLKSLEGTWKGTAEGEGGEAEAEAEAAHDAEHRFEVSAAGSVVMETMAPDSPHEMINMYYMDGDDLVLTHYCSGGNQPRMRLDAAKSTADVLVFDFDGGTNLESAGHHIHSAKIEMSEDGGMVSRWYAAAGGEIVGGMAFRLDRVEAD